MPSMDLPLMRVAIKSTKIGKINILEQHLSIIPAEVPIAKFFSEELNTENDRD